MSSVLLLFQTQHVPVGWHFQQPESVSWSAPLLSSSSQEVNPIVVSIPFFLYLDLDCVSYLQPGISLSPRFPRLRSAPPLPAYVHHIWGARLVCRRHQVLRCWTCWKRPLPPYDELVLDQILYYGILRNPLNASAETNLFWLRDSSQSLQHLTLYNLIGSWSCLTAL